MAAAAETTDSSKSHYVRTKDESIAWHLNARNSIPGIYRWI